MTKAPTREELESMQKQCDDEPEGNVWNWKVSDLIRHYLERLDELEQIRAIMKKIARPKLKTDAIEELLEKDA